MIGTSMLIVLRHREYASSVLEMLNSYGHAAAWGAPRCFLDASPPLIIWGEKAADGDEQDATDLLATLSGHPGVAKVFADAPQHPLAGKALWPKAREVRVADVVFGQGGVVLIAGPCSAESEAQMQAAARVSLEAGVPLMRAGVYKPRTSPYAFQGLGEGGLRLLSEVRKKSGIGVVTEVMDAADIDRVAEHADCLQVGARNMQNFALLRALGRAKKPVLLKRGFGCTVFELLSSAEYILAAGNPDVILCERGIRTFENGTRFTFDLAAIALLKSQSSLPVIADPSHAAGHSGLVAALAKGAVAAGADGLLIEVHPKPSEALSDADQALTPQGLASLVDELAPLAAAIGRHLVRPAPSAERPPSKEALRSADSASTMPPRPSSGGASQDRAPPAVAR